MFFSRKVYSSNKNGEIIVYRSFFETPTIVVKGCQQSGSYLVSMWKYALSKISKETSIKSVLLLGLGGGDVVRLIQKKYKDVEITVIEWDEVMVKIFYDLHKNNNKEKLIIQNRDAFDALEDISGSFDLIIIDLFNGSNPPEGITQERTHRLLSSHLREGGYMFVNFYAHKEYAPSFKNIFSVLEVFMYKVNTIGLYGKNNL